MLVSLVFNLCLVCEGIRLEANNKATVLGLYGAAPNVELRVEDPRAILNDLCLLLISRPVDELRQYRIGLSINGPTGIILFPTAVQTVTAAMKAPLTGC